MNACESILGLSPYQGGKPIEELARELGLTKISKLASNENPLGISIKVKKAINDSLSSINRYPDGNCFELKKAIATKHNVTSEMISLGNGSNELLELIARVFVSKQPDEVIFFTVCVCCLSTCHSGFRGICCCLTCKKLWSRLRFNAEYDYNEY